MKSIILLTAFLFLNALLFAGTPIIDGVFDGEAVYGPPVAVADGAAGWSDVNIDKIYVTYDAAYAYFAALFNDPGAPAPWMHAAFEVNVKADGGPNDPWSAAVEYDYGSNDQHPDYVLVGRLGDDSNWAELRSWNGNDWDGGGVNVFPDDMSWTVDLNCIEGRILKSTLGSEAVDVQFHVSGNNYEQHGTFDACPDDSVVTSWVDTTSLHNYALDVPIDVSAAIGQKDIRPEGFTLKQNFPNPFNPSTVIAWKQPASGAVKLSVFNVTGKKIATLVDAPLPAGEHTVYFNAGTLAGGIYLYRLQFAGKQISKKMLLIR